MNSPSMTQEKEYSSITPIVASKSRYVELIYVTLLLVSRLFLLPRRHIRYERGGKVDSREMAHELVTARDRAN
jgi:hypothetical protein